MFEAGLPEVGPAQVVRPIPPCVSSKSQAQIRGRRVTAASKMGSPPFYLVGRCGRYGRYFRRRRC